jgi:hypothetical protein
MTLDGGCDFARDFINARGQTGALAQTVAVIFHRRE